jgi:hypothetical protein
MDFKAEKDLTTVSCEDAAEYIVTAVSFKSENSPAISEQYFTTLKFSKSKINEIVSKRFKNAGTQSRGISFLDKQSQYSVICELARSR